MFYRTMGLTLGLLLLSCSLSFTQEVFEGQVIFIDVIAFDNGDSAIIDIENDGFRAFAAAILDKNRKILASGFIISSEKQVRLVVKNDSGQTGVGIVVVGWGPKDATAEVSVRIE